MTYTRHTDREYEMPAVAPALMEYDPELERVYDVVEAVVLGIDTTRIEMPEAPRELPRLDN